MVDAGQLARAGYTYLGRLYSEMDCQAFVEKCLSDCGLKVNLPGSNAWFRRMNWTGSPEECRKRFGSIPVGAFLFILKQDGGEPDKYKPDGIGNASHIGIYTGRGKGAIHSSASQGCVVGSRFAGKTINGGWNRVGIWTDQVVYAEIGIRDHNKVQSDTGGDSQMIEVTYQARVTGGKLNLRREPDVNAERIMSIPDGMTVTVTADNAGWSRVEYAGKTGWVKSEYLQELKVDEQTIAVPLSWIRDVLKRLDDLADEIADKTGGRG